MYEIIIKKKKCNRAILSCFNLISNFSSQVRKAAQQGVCSILRGSDFLFTDKAPTHHPAAVTTAKFCIKEMEQAGGKTDGPICTYCEEDK